MAGKRRKKFRYLRKISFLRKFFYLGVISIALLLKYSYEMTKDPYTDYYAQYYEKLSEDIGKLHHTTWECDALCMVQFDFYLETHSSNEGYILSNAFGDVPLSSMFGAQYGLFVTDSNVDSLPEREPVKDEDNDFTSFMLVSASKPSIEYPSLECDGRHEAATDFLTFIAGLQDSICTDTL
ncbi:hypothetical protein [Methylomonas sp. AM2-LC]|uniref:hypothetical protein n=1 Tax=Methylomonas sp. AM2-LC TaxID=3153301 RepID=UPI003266A83B